MLIFQTNCIRIENLKKKKYKNTEKCAKLDAHNTIVNEPRKINPRITDESYYQKYQVEFKEQHESEDSLAL